METQIEHYEPEHLKLWTHPQNYSGAVWPGHYSAGVGQSRDSGALERSNFKCMLEAIDGESDTVTVVRESHWAVGWVEWIAIHQDDSEALREADAIKEKLEGYPVVDEDDYSETEQVDADETWKNCFDPSERAEYIRKHRSQFEFHDFADLRANIRGEYFSGYAYELLH